MTAHLSIMRPSPYAMPPSRIPPSMQYGHRTAPGQQQQQQQHSGAPFSVAPTSTFYHPSTFQNHPMLMQGSHVFSGALHRQADSIQYCHPHIRGNSPGNGGEIGEDPLGVADVKPSCQYSLLHSSAHGEMPLDSSQLGNGQLPPLVTVGSQLQHHSIFAGSMYPTPDYCHTPLGPSTSCLPQLAMWNYPPIPMQKLSYDSPKYKLTPERALPLVKWFEEHKQHPYPTRNEKVLLCQSTQLTFTQVSTWFANARRRMKKSSVDDDKASDDSATESPQGSSPSNKDQCTLPEY